MDLLFKTLGLPQGPHLSGAEDHGDASARQAWNTSDSAGGTAAYQFWNGTAPSFENAADPLWSESAWHACPASWPTAWSDVLMQTASNTPCVLPHADGSPCAPPGLCLPDLLPGAPPLEYYSSWGRDASASAWISSETDATTHGDANEATPLALSQELSPRQTLKTPPGLDIDSTEAGDSPLPAGGVDGDDTICLLDHLPPMPLISPNPRGDDVASPLLPPALQVDAEGLTIRLHEVLFKDEDVPKILKLSEFLCADTAAENVAGSLAAKKNMVSVEGSETDGTTRASEGDDISPETSDHVQQLRRRRGQRRGRRGKKHPSAAAATDAVVEDTEGNAGELEM